MECSSIQVDMNVVKNGKGQKKTEGESTDDFQNLLLTFMPLVNDPNQALPSTESLEIQGEESQSSLSLEIQGKNSQLPLELFNMDRPVNDQFIQQMFDQVGLPTHNKAVQQIIDNEIFSSEEGLNGQKEIKITDDLIKELKNVVNESSELEGSLQKNTLPKSQEQVTPSFMLQDELQDFDTEKLLRTEKRPMLIKNEPAQNPILSEQYEQIASISKNGDEGGLVSHSSLNKQSLEQEFLNQNAYSIRNKLFTKGESGEEKKTEIKPTLDKNQMFSLNQGIEQNQPKIIEAQESHSPIENIQEIAMKMVEEVKEFKNGDHRELQVKLKPEALGDIEIRLEMKNGQIVGKIFVAHEAVKGMLENQMDQLRDQLKGQNIPVQGLEVNISQYGSQQGHEHEQSSFQFKGNHSSIAKEQEEEQSNEYNQEISVNGYGKSSTRKGLSLLG